MKKTTYQQKASGQLKKAIVVYPFTYINPYQAFPPVAAEYMQAGFAAAGLECQLIDMRYESDMEAVKKQLATADVVGIHGYFEDCSLFGKWGIHVISEVIEMVPDTTPLIAGGTGFTDFEEALKEHPKIDIVVRGNPETPLMQLFERGGDPTKVENLVFRVGKKIEKTKRVIHALPEDIYPRRDLRNPRYEYHIVGIKVDLIRAAVGCNYRCKFCFEYGKDFDGSFMSWQGRSADSLLEELKTIDAPLVGWVDDDMTTDMEMLGELSEKLLQSKIKKLYMGTGRIDHVIKSNVESLKKMERAGFLALSFGVESLKDETLKFYGKGQTLTSIEKSMKMMQQTNIFLICNFILGSPGETEEDMMEMLWFGRKWNVDTLVTNRFRMQEDSPMYSLIHNKDGSVKPGMERIDGEELARIKYKIKFGQRTPLRIWLMLLKLYKHKGMVFDPSYIFVSAFDQAIKHTWLEKTLVLPLFFKLLKLILKFPPIRWINWLIAMILYYPVKGINYVFELIDRRLQISTSLMPRFFLFLKDRLYEKQRAKAQINTGTTVKK